MWIQNNDLELLKKVFEPENLIPRNRKGKHKLRHISFYASNMKAITNVCKTLEKFVMHETLAHQYIEVLRKMGLVNKKEEVTKYGKMLMQIMYFDNNRIINEINAATKVDDLPVDIQYTIEFFLFAVVKKCLSDKNECEKNDIDYSDLASETIDNLQYFFSNVIDTIKEPTNKNNNFNDLFNSSDDNFYYILQGINFSGFEIKRLLRLSATDIASTLTAYKTVLETVQRTDKTALTSDEMRFYDYSHYYVENVQKDVRNRVKLSIINYILLNSIVEHRKRLKIVRNPDFERIISYDFIEEVFYKYNLKDVYNLVYFEKESKYLTNIVKPLMIDEAKVSLILGQNKFELQESELRKQNVNMGDEIIFIDEQMKLIYVLRVYKVSDIQKSGTTLTVFVEPLEQINESKKQDILNKFKEN